MELGRLTGAFDLLTVAALDVVEQARERCDRLRARVLDDVRVAAVDGLAPVMPLGERLRLVGALRAVDEAGTAGNEEDPAIEGGSYAFAGPGAPEVLRPRPRARRLPDVEDLLVRTHPGDPGQRVGYVPGGWDMFHVGHLVILERSRAQCDRLVVGVATDEALALAKGRRPLVPFAERAAVVAALETVDEVVADTSPDKITAWQRVGFDVLFKGDDWRGTAKGDRLEAELAQVGAELRYFPYTPHTSSTALRTALAAR